MRTTASIPGTGVSYVKDYGSGKKSGSTRPAGNAPTGGSDSSRKKPIYQRPWFVALVVIILLGAVGSACGSEDATQTDKDAIQQEETVAPEDPDTEEAEEAAEPEEDPAETPEGQEVSEPSQEPNDSQEAAQEDTPAQESQNTPEIAPAASENQESTGSAPVVVTPPASTPASDPEPTPAPQTSEHKTGYVGSIDSDKYHSPGCRWAKKILPENEIWFESAEAAKAAGYSPCGTCQ